MRRRTALLSLLLIATAACQPDGGSVTSAMPADAASAEAAARIEADVRYLASDELEGRQTGERGYQLAAEHVARRYADLGLEPAGDDGTYFQRVPLLRATRGAGGSRFEIERDGNTTALESGKHYLPGLNYQDATHSLRAPAVFVGHGVSAPELDYDDFAGVDLRGRIAIVLSGAPSRFDNDRRAFYSNGTQKMRTLAAKGAIGVVMLNSRVHERRTPWERTARTAPMPGMRLRGEDGKGVDSFPQIQATAMAGAAAAEAIFAGSGRSAAEVFDAAEAGKLTPFELPGTLLLAGSTTIEPLESRNVASRLPGSDPSLSSEHIVYSAHLDHVGVGPEEDGDGIYNGALDNALGTAIMLEAARGLGAGAAPRRSIVFVAVTAEEKGLLGAQWFATQPPAGVAQMVANINMDMPVLLAPTRDVVPIGVEHSSLQAVLETAAAEVGVSLSPDPAPEEVVFVRSDQFAFVRAGVPAVYLKGGVLAAEGSDIDPVAAEDAFRRNCYHRPCDDVSQPIQYGDAARLARLNARIGQLVGDADQRPTWNRGDFFGDMFGAAATAGTGTGPAP
jgi:hypothetical protein